MLKLVLLAAIVLLVVWLLRGTRRVPPPSASDAPARGKTLEREDMVACERCGMHMPRSDALPGRGGFFCGEAHRAEHERAGDGR